jgi:hypothetical protein
VNDEVTAVKRRSGFRSEQSVRVGNHAEVKIDFSHANGSNFRALAVS